jgi:hypothetical protein
MAAAAELIDRYPFASSLEVEAGAAQLRLAASLEKRESTGEFFNAEPSTLLATIRCERHSPARVNQTAGGDFEAVCWTGFILR